jgi:hypothetical protein
MKIDRVQVHTTDQKVEIHSTHPKLEMSTTNAKVDIQQPAAILEMHTEPAKLLIDQSQAWRDMGLLTPMESVKDAAQKGMQKVAEGTKRRAREGDQMMHIETGGDKIAQIAKGKLGIQPVRSALKWIPSVDAVKSTYVAGRLDIKITPQAPRFDVTIGDVQGQYTPGTVTGTTVQRASVETNVIKGE